MDQSIINLSIANILFYEYDFIYNTIIVDFCFSLYAKNSSLFNITEINN